MYYITGADGKEYGPVTLEKVGLWISEGRVNERTRIKSAGSTEWKPAGEMAEFIPLFQVGAQASQTSVPVPPPVPSRTLAVASLVLGVLSVLCLAPLTAIPAIICGHMARGRIRRAPGLYQGANQALVGLVLGYLSIALMISILPAMLLPALSRAKGRAQEINCRNNMRQMALACKIWAVDNGNQFPFNVSTNKGGTLEFATPSESGGDPNGYRHLTVMSNELSVTKILICPADTKKAAPDFSSLGPENVSYEIMSGPDVTDNNPEQVLARCPIHHHEARVDGSVR